MISAVSILYVLCLPEVTDIGSYSDKIVAVVNDAIITHSQLLQTQSLPAVQANRPAQENSAGSLREVLDELIDAKLIEEKITQTPEIVLSKRELEHAVQVYARSLGMTLDELTQAVEQSGTSFVQFKRQLKAQREQERLLQRLFAPQLQITASMVRQACQIQHAVPGKERAVCLDAAVFMASPAQTSAGVDTYTDALLQAQQAADALAQGLSFAQLLEQRGISQQQANMGCFTRSQLSKPLLAAVWDKKRSEPTPPVRLGDNVALVRVRDWVYKQSPSICDRKEVQAQVTRTLFESRFAQARQKLLAQARAQAYIDIRL